MFISIIKNDLLILFLKFYGFYFTLSVPFFFLYIWVSKKFNDYIGYSFVLLNGLKTVFYGVFIMCFFYKELGNNTVFIVILNSIIIYYVFLLAEQISLVKLLA